MYLKIYVLYTVTTLCSWLVCLYGFAVKCIMSLRLGSGFTSMVYFQIYVSDFRFKFSVEILMVPLVDISPPPIVLTKLACVRKLCTLRCFIKLTYTSQFFKTFYLILQNQITSESLLYKNESRIDCCNFVDTDVKSCSF